MPRRTFQAAFCCVTSDAHRRGATRALESEKRGADSRPKPPVCQDVSPPTQSLLAVKTSCHQQPRQPPGNANSDWARPCAFRRRAWHFGLASGGEARGAGCAISRPLCVGFGFRPQRCRAGTEAGPHSAQSSQPPALTAPSPHSAQPPWRKGPRLRSRRLGVWKQPRPVSSAESLGLCGRTTRGRSGRGGGQRGRGHAGRG